MVPGARADSVTRAQREPAPELEVLLGHQPFALRCLGLSQMPQQELLADGRRGKPNPGFDCRIQIGVFRPKSSLPDALLHRTSSKTVGVRR